MLSELVSRNGIFTKPRPLSPRQLAYDWQTGLDVKRRMALTLARRSVALGHRLDVVTRAAPRFHAAFDGPVGARTALGVLEPPEQHFLRPLSP